MKEEVIKMNNYNESENKEIRLRGWVSIVCMVISAIIALMFFIKAVGNDSLPEVIVSSLIVGFVVGGIFPGITHISAIFNKISRLLAFPFVGWAIWLWLIIGIPFLGGWVFMLVDFVKFLMLRKEEK